MGPTCESELVTTRRDPHTPDEGEPPSDGVWLFVFVVVGLMIAIGAQLFD
jgi:hypothetical protein